VTFIRHAAVSLGVLAGAASPISASAADGSSGTKVVISSLQGAAFVSRADGVVPALAGMELEPLARVFTLQGSQATVTFADGCVHQVPGNAVLTITDDTTCASVASVEREARAQMGAEAAESSPTPEGGMFQQQIGANTAAGAGLAALGIFAGAGFIWAATNDDNDRRSGSISPE
jgi:hypothetical protein